MSDNGKRNRDKLTIETKRLWGDAPVVDAGHELRVIIQPCDVASATVKDPGCCVFAQACKRSLGARKVLFLRTVAYVELPNADGTMRVERFELPKIMRELISNFDQGKDVLPKAGFVMKPPTPANRLDAKVARDRFRTRRNKDALLKGKRTGAEKAAGSRGKDLKELMVLVDVEVRNGKGMVHFSKNAAAADV